MHQLPLDVRLARHAVFDSYYPGANALAVATLRAMAAGSGPPAAWLWGTGGTGKTHLLQAAVALAHQRGAPSAYLPLASLGDRDPAILDGMGSLELVAVDDVAAVAGHDAWERALLRLYEQVQGRAGRLVLAAEAPPAECGLALADLRSRLSAGAVFHLESLSEAECLAALQRRAEWLGCTLPAETAQFLLARVERSPASLFGLLDRLDRAALAAQRRLTIPFVRSVLEAGA